MLDSYNISVDQTNTQEHKKRAFISQQKENKEVSGYLNICREYYKIINKNMYIAWNY